MINVKTFGKSACFAAALGVASYGVANATEKKSPMEPGATTGAAAGALPPEGFYFTIDDAIVTGKGMDGSGNKVHLAGGSTNKFLQDELVPTLLWVPGWTVLGASYGMQITQPYLFLSNDFQGSLMGATGDSTSGQGFMNTSVTPAILSWDVGKGLFTSVGLTFMVKDGHYSHKTGTNLNGQTAQVSSYGSFANNFWTFMPNFAVSYLTNGWNFTLNNMFEFDTKNETSGYQSGNAYYGDLTAAKTYGAWTFGVIGTYSAQYENDEINGVVVQDNPGVNSRGNQFVHIQAGPLVSYNFGKATLTVRYLQDLHTENDVNVSTLHVSLSVPF